MAALCVPRLGQACVVYLFQDGLTYGEVALVKHADPCRQQVLDTLARGALNNPHTRELLLQAALTRLPMILSPLRTVEFLGDGRPAHVLQRDLQLKTAVLVPVADTERVVGIVMCLAASTRFYTSRQIRIARELSDRFGLALTAAQMYAACKTALDTTQELLATTIHDLMSPLTYIKGSAQRLRRLDWSRIDPATTSEFEKRLSAIDSAVVRMAAAMSGLMDSTRPQRPTPRRQMRPELTDLSAVANEIVALEQMIAPDRRIHLDEHQQEPLVGSWDCVDIQRMLANIIGNAVKYSPSGQPVNVQLNSEVDAEGRWAVVCVIDRGIGIPSGDLPFVFEPFRRGANVGPVPGTGLGLASVWQIVHSHEGQLSVESEVGKGTSFKIRLPLVGA